MAEKRDDLDVLGAIRPARDEVSSYRRSNRPEASSQSSFNGLLVFVILVLAIMMGVGGFTLYEVQKKLDQSDVLLTKGQQSVQQLEDRLAATGTDVSTTLQNMQSQMDTNISEIDKLWKVSFRENRPDIMKNQASIGKLRSDQEATLLPLDQAVHNLVENFSALSSDMTGVREKLTADSEKMTTQVTRVRDQVQDQSVQVEGNKRDISILSGHVKETQEAIDVIDQYRKQINQRLMDLQARIQDLSSSQTTNP